MCRPSHGAVVTGSFDRAYSDQYDALYRAKDYGAECDVIKELFRRYGTGTVDTVLDLGCGTGSHALLLSDSGYSVTGVDRSVAMLEHARAKAAARQGVRAPAFVEGDLRTVRLGRTFDAVLMMFAVLGYQLSNEEVMAALRTVREHLRPGGLLVCDVWFGPGVLCIGPSDRLRVVEDGQDQVIRAASGTVDAMTHTCRVRYQVWRLAGDRLVSRSAEEHVMRYFFPLELEHYLGQCKLQLCAIRPFENLESVPGSDTWNVWVCARAT
jgi:SAM-dependent methyltransferase